METTHAGTALIHCAARKATVSATNGLVASTLEQIGACRSLTSLIQSVASTAVIMPANVRPAGGPLENANIEWHSSLQQCRFLAECLKTAHHRTSRHIITQHWCL